MRASLLLYVCLFSAWIGSGCSAPEAADEPDLPLEAEEDEADEPLATEEQGR